MNIETLTIPARRPALTLAFVIAAELLLAPSMVVAQAPGPGPGAAAGPSEVGVIELALQQVPYSVTVPGRAAAYSQVAIRPRVQGVVIEIVYTPGQPVRAGDLLFRIDDRSARADLASTEASLAKAEVGLASAQATLERYEKLAGTGISEETVATAAAAVEESKADVAAAKAARETARIALELTEIRSPIDGIADIAEVNVGDIVTANQSDALTTVTRLDPIYVDMAESFVRILDVRERFEAGTLEPGDRLQLSLTLDNGQTYGGEGELVSPGTAVSTTTGTTTLRVKFENPDRKILPGQFLRVNATIGTSTAILVPQGATSRNSDGSLTAFVARDGKSVQVTLTEEGSYQNAWVVTGGVEEGDALIVDGLKSMRAGTEVTTVPVTIAEDGVVRDMTGDGNAAPAASNGN